MKKEKTKNQVYLQTTKGHGMPRRNFFKLLGSGIIIFFNPWGFPVLSGKPAVQSRALPKDYNAFLMIAED